MYNIDIKNITNSMIVVFLRKMGLFLLNNILFGIKTITILACAFLLALIVFILPFIAIELIKYNIFLSILFFILELFILGFFVSKF